MTESFERKRDYLEGFLAQKPVTDSAGTPGGALYDGVIEALKDIYDPEIPVNIYDLGLIYGLRVDPASAQVDIRMTLTSPGCPVAQSFPGKVAETVGQLDGVEVVDVELVWEPPWSKALMSGRLAHWAFRSMSR